MTSEVKRFGRIGDMVEATEGILKLYPMMSVYVLASDFDRATAERDAALADAELWRSRCGAKCYSVTVLRGLLDRVVTEVGRTITSELRADIDTEMSATRSPEIDAMQRRLTAADERAHVLERLLWEYVDRDEVTNDWAREWLSAVDAVLKPAEAPPCCTVSAEDRALLEAGDYTPEELFGVGGKPSCPKCAKS